MSSEPPATVAVNGDGADSKVSPTPSPQTQDLKSPHGKSPESETLKDVASKEDTAAAAEVKVEVSSPPVTSGNDKKSESKSGDSSPQPSPPVSAEVKPNDNSDAAAQVESTNDVTEKSSSGDKDDQSSPKEPKVLSKPESVKEEVVTKDEPGKSSTDTATPSGTTATSPSKDNSAVSGTVDDRGADNKTEGSVKSASSDAGDAPAAKKESGNASLVNGDSECNGVLANGEAGANGVFDSVEIKMEAAESEVVCAANDLNDKDDDDVVLIVDHSTSKDNVSDEGKEKTPEKAAEKLERLAMDLEKYIVVGSDMIEPIMKKDAKNKVLSAVTPDECKPTIKEDGEVIENMVIGGKPYICGTAVPSDVESIAKPEKVSGTNSSENQIDSASGSSPKSASPAHEIAVIEEKVVCETERSSAQESTAAQSNLAVEESSMEISSETQVEIVESKEEVIEKCESISVVQESSSLVRESSEQTTSTSEVSEKVEVEKETESEVIKVAEKIESESIVDSEVNQVTETSKEIIESESTDVASKIETEEVEVTSATKVTVSSETVEKSESIQVTEAIEATQNVEIQTVSEKVVETESSQQVEESSLTERSETVEINESSEIIRSVTAESNESSTAKVIESASTEVTESVTAVTTQSVSAGTTESTAETTEAEISETIESISAKTTESVSAEITKSLTSETTQSITSETIETAITESTESVTAETTESVMTESSKITEASSETVEATTETVEATSKTEVATSKTVEATSETVEATSETVEATSETVEATSETVEATPETVEATPETVEATSETVEVVSAKVEASSSTVEATSKVVESSVKTTAKEDVKPKRPLVAPKSGGRVSRKRSPLKTAKRRSMREEGHDSGVDESTQSQQTASLRGSSRTYDVVNNNRNRQNFRDFTNLSSFSKTRTNANERFGVSEYSFTRSRPDNVKLSPRSVQDQNANACIGEVGTNIQGPNTSLKASTDDKNLLTKGDIDHKTTRGSNVQKQQNVGGAMDIKKSNESLKGSHDTQVKHHNENNKKKSPRRTGKFLSGLFSRSPKISRKKDCSDKNGNVDKEEEVSALINLAKKQASHTSNVAVTNNSFPAVAKRTSKDSTAESLNRMDRDERVAHRNINQTVPPYSEKENSDLKPSPSSRGTMLPKECGLASRKSISDQLDFMTQSVYFEKVHSVPIDRSKPTARVTKTYSQYTSKSTIGSTSLSDTKPVVNAPTVYSLLSSPKPRRDEQANVDGAAVNKIAAERPVVHNTKHENGNEVTRDNVKTTSLAKEKIVADGKLQPLNDSNTGKPSLSQEGKNSSDATEKNTASSVQGDQKVNVVRTLLEKQIVPEISVLKTWQGTTESRASKRVQDISRYFEEQHNGKRFAFDKNKNSISTAVEEAAQKLSGLAVSGNATRGNTQATKTVKCQAENGNVEEEICVRKNMYNCGLGNSGNAELKLTSSTSMLSQSVSRSQDERSAKTGRGAKACENNGNSAGKLAKDVKLITRSTESSKCVSSDKKNLTVIDQSSPKYRMKSNSESEAFVPTNLVKKSLASSTSKVDKSSTATATHLRVSRSGNRNGESASPPKGGRTTPRKRQPRSVDPSPMKRMSGSTSTSVERKKLPMNKIEVGKSASPNLKQVKSKIGSLNNAAYKPGGGNIRIESKKLDYSKASSRIAAKNQEYAPKGGEKKIESQKLKWNVQSKVGSLDNATHKAGGGNRKIESQKLNFKDGAQSKVGSRDNIKHKAGGGDVMTNKIQEQKLDFKDKASSKVGSLNNVTHRPGGGEKKIFDDKDYLRQMSNESRSPCKTPSVTGSEYSASRPESPEGTNQTSRATSGVASPQPSDA